jgi:branched-chain amino acid transport system permease protein
MNQFVTLLAHGLSLGCITALIALGFVIVFKTTRVVNFAHGSLLLLGAYIVGRAHDSVGFWPSVLIAVAATAGTALLIGFVLRRWGRRADPGTLAIITLGLDIVMATELVRRIGTDVLSTGDPWGADVIQIGGVRIPEARVAAAAVAVVLVTAFLAVLRFSEWGVALRASTERPDTAALMGIRLGRVTGAAWALAGGLAALAGLFFTAFPAAGIGGGAGQAALAAAVPAAVLGGLDSTTGALVGGVTVGVVATLAAGYQDHLAFAGRGVASVVPYLVMVLVLLIRPSGLFGGKEITRV